jgi:hypothetical protein
MARAYGSNAHLLMKRETTYGQAATGNYIRMPFNRCNLGSEQGLIDDPVLGQGRDPLAPPAAITSPCFRNCCRGRGRLCRGAVHRRGWTSLKLEQRYQLRWSFLLSLRRAARP